MQAVVVVTKKKGWFRKGAAEVFPLENFRISTNGILIIGTGQYNNKKAFADGAWISASVEEIE